MEDSILPEAEVSVVGIVVGEDWSAEAMGQRTWVRYPPGSGSDLSPDFGWWTCL